MNKFWIGEKGEEVILEICWLDKDGECDEIYLEDTVINFPGSMYKEDIPKLIKALQKAKELGWWKEEGKV